MWTKNGEALQNDGHYLLVDDSQYLLIKETRSDDLGTYTCELTNILGTTREHINLSLRGNHTTITSTTHCPFPSHCLIILYLYTTL